MHADVHRLLAAADLLVETEAKRDELFAMVDADLQVARPARPGPRGCDARAARAARPGLRGRLKEKGGLIFAGARSRFSASFRMGKLPPDSTFWIRRRQVARSRATTQPLMERPAEEPVRLPDRHRALTCRRATRPAAWAAGDQVVQVAGRRGAPGAAGGGGGPAGAAPGGRGRAGGGRRSAAAEVRPRSLVPRPPAPDAGLPRSGFSRSPPARERVAIAVTEAGTLSWVTEAGSLSFPAVAVLPPWPTALLPL